MAEKSLPYATMIKFIEKNNKSNLHFQKATIEIVKEAGQAFIHCLINETLEVCDKSNRTLISPKIFYQTLQKIGLGCMIEELRNLENSLKTRKIKKQQNKEIIRKKIEQMYRTCFEQGNVRDEQNPLKLSQTFQQNRQMEAEDKQQEDFQRYILNDMNNI